VEALKDKTAVAVMDRAISFGAMGGALYLEFCAAFHQLGGPRLVKNHVFGLGGRDIQPREIEGVGRDLAKTAETGAIGERVEYLGVRE
jgi:pyruvate ferredoxin oxidoreductase alpha subunit